MDWIGLDISQTTIAARALLRMSGANNVWAIFETNFLDTAKIVKSSSDIPPTSTDSLLTSTYSLLSL